jgi:putative ABC transport system permease protein
MDFFLSLFLCVVGFLIYWIMSIRNRELLFGIYRAMGMQMREIRRMIFNEQMFGSVFPILAGIGVGAITTRLFVKLETLVYLPRKHNLAISVEISSADLGRRLALVSGMVVFCAFVLMRLMRKLKITQALKLGED